jgi:two-component system OmpR family sensor kinase
VLQQLSLRTRLILGVIVLAAVGLVAADVATYSSLRSFLIDQTDSSLDAAHHAVDAFVHGQSPQLGFGNSVSGDYVGLRTTGGQTRLGYAPRFYNDKTPPAPALPKKISLPPPGSGPTDESVSYFTTGAAHGGGHYRVRAWTNGDSTYTLLLAQPLTSVDATLHRLLWIELLVTALVLVALAALGLWVVRLGLRPLAAIAATAAKIGAGDLTQRIEREDDRTEIGRLGRALNAMLAQIEAGYRAREESEGKLRRFVADASHELRTPLAAVRAYAELFGRGAAERPADLERSMAGIGRESERMSLLVEDLLLLARLDEGRPLAQERVRLDEVVSEAIDAARAVDPQRPIDSEVAETVVVGDHDRLRQVVDNLLANIRAHTPPASPAHIRVVPNGEYAVVEIADEGPGLDDEQLEHIFERFYRTDSSRARASGGVGLGLSIVDAVMRAHGGRASATSQPGKGTTVRLELPLVTGNPQSTPTPSPGGSASLETWQPDRTSSSSTTTTPSAS